MSDNITPVVIARIRRGKYVRIPAEWRGKVTDRQTIRKRQSKHPRKLRKRRHLKPGERG